MTAAPDRTQTAVTIPATGPTTGPVPRVAVIVAVIELLGPEETRRLARDLAAKAGAAAPEVRVVLRSDTADSVPQRRRRAVDAVDDGSGAQAVLLIEDTTRLAPGWADALRTAFADVRVAAVGGTVQISPALPPRYRALGRLEYGRFDGTRPDAHLPGNAFAVRLPDLRQVLAPGEGIVEHELEQRVRVRDRDRTVCAAPGLTAIYDGPDRHGARLSTRFGHGRLYGAGRGGNRVSGVARALLAMPVLSLRAGRAACAAGPARQWLPELPWIVAMSTAWALGELTGQIAGRGNSEGSWT